MTHLEIPSSHAPAADIQTSEEALCSASKSKPRSDAPLPVEPSKIDVQVNIYKDLPEEVFSELIGMTANLGHDYKTKLAKFVDKMMDLTPVWAFLEEQLKRDKDSKVNAMRLALILFRKNRDSCSLSPIFQDYLKILADYRDVPALEASFNEILTSEPFPDAAHVFICMLLMDAAEVHVTPTNETMVDDVSSLDKVKGPWLYGIYKAISSKLPSNEILEMLNRIDVDSTQTLIIRAADLKDEEALMALIPLYKMNRKFKYSLGKEYLFKAAAIAGLDRICLHLMQEHPKMTIRSWMFAAVLEFCDVSTYETMKGMKIERDLFKRTSIPTASIKNRRCPGMFRKYYDDHEQLDDLFSNPKTSNFQKFLITAIDYAHTEAIDILLPEKADLNIAIERAAYNRNKPLVRRICEMPRFVPGPVAISLFTEHSIPFLLKYCPRTLAGIDVEKVMDHSMSGCFPEELDILYPFMSNDWKRGCVKIQLDRMITNPISQHGFGMRCKILEMMIRILRENGPNAFPSVPNSDHWRILKNAAFNIDTKLEDTGPLRDFQLLVWTAAVLLDDDAHLDTPLSEFVSSLSEEDLDRYSRSARGTWSI